MAINIFEMFGSIKADDKPAKQAIDNVVGYAKKADSSLSQTLGKVGGHLTNAGKRISSAGDTLTRKITKPAVAATSALVGITLVKGFNRLTGIDDARAKLLGLGHDGQSVDKIMKSALDSVKGTSFGMDEAATTAAGAVAAGVKSGQELTKYLSLTADAAAIAGTSMSEMGSIINKVQTGQQAYTDDLNQLADRGLPIYQWIAKEANISAGEVKKFASEGKVSSEMFLSAIEKNIGGAAAIMGENSFKASIANIWASVGRIGANFLDAGGKGGGFFSTLKPMLADFNERMGTLEDTAADLGVKFGESFQGVIAFVNKLMDRWDKLSPSMQGHILAIVGKFTLLLVTLGPILKVIGSLTSGVGNFLKGLGHTMDFVSKVGGLAAKGIKAASDSTTILGTVFSALSSPIGLVILSIAALASVLFYLYNTNENVRNALQNAWKAFSDFIQPLVQVISDFIRSVWGQLMSWWNTNQQTILAITQMVWGVIKSVFELAMIAITFVVKQTLTTLEFLWTVFGNAIRSIVQILWTVVSNLFKGGLSSILAIVSMVLDQIKNSFDFVMNTIKSIIKIVLSAIKGDWKGVLDGIMGIINGFRSYVSKTFENIMGTAKTLVFNGINTIKNIFHGLANINLMDAGRAIIDGFVRGLRSSWENGKKFVSGIASWIKDHKGPIEYDRKLLIPHGKAIMGGLNQSLMDEFKKVQSNVSSMADLLASEMSTNDLSMADIPKMLDYLSLSPASRETPYTDRGVSERNPVKTQGDTYNINLQALGELSDIQLMDMARKLVRFIKELKDREDSPKGGVFNGI